MKREELDLHFAGHQRAMRGTIVAVFGSLILCFALVMGWRYFTIGALEYPKRGTDYFAVVVFGLWVLACAPLAGFRERQSLRLHGLYCPHCHRQWRLSARKQLFASSSCPHCHVQLWAPSNEQ